jgi:hypothetical protein
MGLNKKIIVPKTKREEKKEKESKAIESSIDSFFFSFVDLLLLLVHVFAKDLTRRRKDPAHHDIG